MQRMLNAVTGDAPGRDQEGVKRSERQDMPPSSLAHSELPISRRVKPAARMASRVRALQGLGCRWVTTFLEVGWGVDGILPHFGAERVERRQRGIGHERVAGE